MLKITIPSIEQYDEVNNEFINITTKDTVLHLEHSLVSLSKWEAKWCKPFLSDEDKTPEETADYIACMTITQNVNPELYDHLPNWVIAIVNEYMKAPMTATVISSLNRKKNRDIITAEIIYYWMIALNIPFECQKWHLNRLLMLVQVCNEKSNPPKKMGRNEVLSRQASINAARRKALNSKG